MARTTQISKEKQQSIIILRHEGQSIWKVLSSAVAKPSNAMMKLSLMRTTTDKFIRVNCTSDIAA
jgi:hypothetical protein